MTPEFWAIIAVGVALAGLLIGQGRSLSARMDRVEAEVSGLRERMAHLEGLLEGLRDAIGQSRAA